MSFWYNLTRPDDVAWDWATATIKDNTTGTTATVLAKTCIASSGWKQVTTAITAGHSYTLTLTSKDDNRARNATYQSPAFAPVGSAASPLGLLSYISPISNDAVTVDFRQPIGANDALRTGTYSKTLTFTLSTTNP